MFDLAMFYVFAVLAIGAAMLVVTRKNVIHSAIFLATALLATAGSLVHRRLQHGVGADLRTRLLNRRLGRAQGIVRIRIEGVHGAGMRDGCRLRTPGLIDRRSEDQQKGNQKQNCS